MLFLVSVNDKTTMVRHGGHITSAQGADTICIKLRVLTECVEGPTIVVAKFGSACELQPSTLPHHGVSS